MFNFKYILFSFVLFCYHVVISQKIVNVTEYYSMPPLYDLSNFDQCQSQGNLYKYCLFEVQLFLATNESQSQIWDTIERVNSDKTSFEHHKLRKGRCVSNNLTDLELIEQYTEVFNEEFLNDDLRVQVNGLYCNRFKRKLDELDKIALYVLLSWITFILVCTIFCDVIRKKVTKCNCIGFKLLQCFSLSANWKRLTSKDNGRRTYDYIHSIRFFIMVAVIFAHSLLLSYNKPFLNPQFFEQNYKNWVKNSIRVGVLCIQTFFLFSGIFLAQPFYGFIDKMKFRFEYIFGAIVGRYVRLTPTYFAVIFFNMTLLYYVNNGYLWDELVGNERRVCRDEWWINILYLNSNFGSMNCMSIGWYLAADFQLHLISLVILSLMWFMKQHKMMILWIALIISIIIPGVVTYVYDLEPLPLVYPKIARAFLINNETFRKTYVQFYANATSYILGLLVGYLYYTNKMDKPLFKFVEKLWLQKIVLFLIALYFLVILPFGGHFIYSGLFNYGIIFTVLFATLSKLIYSAVTCVILYGLNQKLGYIFLKFLEWRPFVALGRLAFCIYLIHWPYLLARSASELSIVHYDSKTQMQEILSNIVFITLISLVLNLVVEGPVTALVTLVKSVAWKTEEEDKVRQDDVEKMKKSGNFSLKTV